MDSATCLLTPPLTATTDPLPLTDPSDLHLDLASSTKADPPDLTASLSTIESVLSDILSQSAITRTPSSAVRLFHPDPNPARASLLDTSPQTLCDRSAQATHVVLSDCYESHLPRLRNLVWDWLLCLVRRATQHLMAMADEDEDEDDPAWEIWDDMSTRASALMSALSGPASAGERTRTFVFDALQLKVREASLQAADLGGTTWGAGVVLASLIDQQLVRFPSGATILELGSGTGLGGLATQSVDLSAHVIMTDYHLGVLDTLRANVNMNFAPRPHHVHVQQLDWRWYLTPPPPSSLHACNISSLPRLDAIMAADVVYERASVAAIHAVLSTLVKTKSSMIVLIVLPMRPRYHDDVIEFEQVVASEFCARQAVIEYNGGWYKAYGNDRAKEAMPGLFA